jgi:hypothetical protein
MIVVPHEVRPGFAEPVLDFAGIGPSIIACTAEAENGVPRRVRCPIAASSLLILRNDRRFALTCRTC